MEGGQETLLMGGWTNTQGEYSTSIELVTDTVSCEADIPRLPVGSEWSAATVLGQTILYCGGYGVNEPRYRANCYSYTMGKTGATWEEAASMVHPRYYFSLNSYEGNLVFNWYSMKGATVL